MKRCAQVSVAMIALLVAVPAVVSAQQAEPLARDEVERLITGDTYSQAEVAEIVRRSCLTFRPTSGDMDRFRSLGAADAVLDAIRSCAAAEGDEPTPEVLELTIVDASLEAPVGRNVELVVRLRRNAQPVAGVPVVLEGTDSLPGVDGRLEATSDDSGVAAIRIPTGSTPATYTFRVLARGYWLQGANQATLDVVAGAPARVAVEPARIRIAADRTAPVAVSVSVSDSFGNPVPRAEVRLRGDGAPRAEDREWAVTTGSDGTASLEIPAAELAGVESISASAGTEATDRVAVAREPVEEAPAERAEPAPEEEREEPAPAVEPEVEAPREAAQPTGIAVSVWGGKTFDNNRDPGIRAAKLSIEPSPNVEIWGRFDHTLAMVRPYTKRGEVDDISFFGGFEVDYGSGRFSTFVEGGRRQHAVTDLWETLGHLRQTIRFGDEGAPAFERPSVMVGGFVGSWPDRTDWGVEAGFGIPTSPGFRLEGLGAVTETVAMRADPTLVAARDMRFELTGRGRFGGGWEIAPTAVVGSVTESDLGEDREGELFEGRFYVHSAPIGGVLRVLGFFRVQDHPESDDFSQAALGFSVGSFR